MRRFGQAQRDLPHAEVLVDVPAEDLPHDLRLGSRHLDVGRDSVAPWNPPVAVGDLPLKHFALSRTKELASTVAFRDLDALVFGNRALDLREQARLRIIRQGLVEKDRVDGEAVLQQALDNRPAGRLDRHADFARVARRERQQPVRHLRQARTTMLELPFPELLPGGIKHARLMFLRSPVDTREPLQLLSPVTQ